MNLKYPSRLVVVIAFLFTGCSSLPGLRVLTGQDTQENRANQVVTELDLVMADKTGATDPSLISAADRIEAASGDVDIIEIRQDMENDSFIVNMLFLPPGSPDTLEGQIATLDALRRAIELTWQAVLPESIGSGLIHISLLQPQPIATLDSGQSFIGRVIVNADITREDATAYLSGTRSLDNFYSLIVSGTLNYRSPEAFTLYEGRPNHPMFMIQSPVVQ